MEDADAIIMGRNTFEQALTFGDWPYADKKMIVMSNKGVEIPERLRQTVSVTSQTPALLLENLASQGVRQVYVDGGLTIQSFLREGLINELTITVIPVLLGSGKPLFASLKADIKLRHVFSKSYPFGFVQSKYAVE
jgi:dihydrofolate reductase